MFQNDISTRNVTFGSSPIRELNINLDKIKIQNL